MAYTTCYTEIGNSADFRSIFHFTILNSAHSKYILIIILFDVYFFFNRAGLLLYYIYFMSASSLACKKTAAVYLKTLAFAIMWLTPTCANNKNVSSFERDFKSSHICQIQGSLYDIGEACHLLSEPCWAWATTGCCLVCPPHSGPTQHWQSIRLQLLYLPFI